MKVLRGQLCFCFFLIIALKLNLAPEIILIVRVLEGIPTPQCLSQHSCIIYYIYKPIGPQNGVDLIWEDRFRSANCSFDFNIKKKKKEEVNRMFSLLENKLIDWLTALHCFLSVTIFSSAVSRLAEAYVYVCMVATEGRTRIGTGL